MEDRANPSHAERPRFILALLASGLVGVAGAGVGTLLSGLDRGGANSSPTGLVAAALVAGLVGFALCRPRRLPQSRHSFVAIVLIGGLSAALTLLLSLSAQERQETARTMVERADVILSETERALKKSVSMIEALAEDAGQVDAATLREDAGFFIGHVASLTRVWCFHSSGDGPWVEPEAGGDPAFDAPVEEVHRGAEESEETAVSRLLTLDDEAVFIVAASPAPRLPGVIVGAIDLAATLAPVAERAHDRGFSARFAIEERVLAEYSTTGDASFAQHRGLDFHGNPIVVTVEPRAAFFADEASPLPTVAFTLTLVVTLLMALTGHLYQRGLHQNQALRVAMDDLRSGASRFRRFAEHIKDVFWITEWPSCKVTYVSPAYEDLWGRAGDDLERVDREFFEAVHEGDRERVSASFRQRADQGFDETYRVVRPDGTIRWVHDRGVPIQNDDGVIYRILGVAKDVTDMKRHQSAQERARGRMQQLASRVVAVREDERREVAREIHDVLGQALTAIKFDLDWMRRRVLDDDASERERDEERLDSMTRLINDTMDSVRKLSTRLRPTVLDDLGLKAALEWQVRDFSQRTGTHCRLTVLPDPLDPASDRDTALFRILQEALTNVTRHAEAKDVAVRLDRVDGDLCLSVRDDGRGIRPEQVDQDESFGLLGMRERAEALGGRFEISSGAAAGTIVQVAIPVVPIAQGGSK